MEDLNQNPEIKKLEYAGFWLRFVAYIIDVFIIGIVELIIAIPLILMVGIAAFKINRENISDPDYIAYLGAILGVALVFSLIATILQWLYFALMESYKGATFGKMAMGLKVTDMDGNQISFLRATGRYFGKIVSGITLLIGYIMAGFTEKKQALHDLMSNCLVVKK